MKRLVVLALALAVIVAIAFVAYPRPKKQTVLRMYAGAGLRPAIEKLVAAFEAETGIKVEADYGGSGMIISRARDDKTLDLFLPGDEWYVDQLQQFTGQVKEQVTIAWFVPTIVVAKGNPKGIRGLGDFARSDVQVGLGKAEACQVGRVSAQILARAGVDKIGRDPQESQTVNELGVWVKMKAVDAAIVWDAIAANIAEDVDTIAIPPEQNIVSRVVLASMTTSPHPESAELLLKFVQGPKGQQILHDSGYRVVGPIATMPAE